MTMTLADSLRARIEQVIGLAEADLQREAGGHSVCQLHKDGTVPMALKHAEGRLTALDELRRALVADPGAYASRLPEIAAAWQQHQLDAPSPLWQAYYAGGAAELQALSDGLDGRAG